MLITVALSAREYAELEKLAQYRAGMDAETLLRCFAGDLTHSEYSGGSDERMYAHQWLDRRFCPEWLMREVRAKQTKKKGAKN